MSENRAAWPRHDAIGLHEIPYRRITAAADTAHAPTARVRTARVHLAHVHLSEPVQNGAVQ